MTTTWYRIQTADRDVTDLLDPEQQVSYSWTSDEESRVGVSVCESLESLAAYLASEPGSGIPFGAGEWVIVELTADRESYDTPMDAAYGEHLVHPVAITSVAPLDDAFFDMIGAAYDALAA